MIFIKCFIEHSDFDNLEFKYIDIDNKNEIKEKVISHKSFDTIYIKMTLTITANNTCLLGLDFDSGLSIWQDYIWAVEKLLQEGKVNQYYGIDGYKLEMELLDKDTVFICIYHEWEPSKKYINEVFPAKEFLGTLVLEIKNFLKKLKSYGALEREPRCEEERFEIEDEIIIFKDNLKRVESLEEKIKCYFN